jgi:hypothetical protein
LKPEIEIHERQDTKFSDAALRRLITTVIRKCSKKREQIVAEMSTRLGQHITVHTLNALTSASNKGARFPAAWLQCFSEVVNDDRLERLVISKRNRETLEFGEIAKSILDEAAQKGLKSLAGGKRQPTNRK